MLRCTQFDVLQDLLSDPEWHRIVTEDSTHQLVAGSRYKIDRAINEKMREWKVFEKMTSTIQEIADKVNPVLTGLMTTANLQNNNYEVHENGKCKVCMYEYY